MEYTVNKLTVESGESFRSDRTRTGGAGDAHRDDHLGGPDQHLDQHDLVSIRPTVSMIEADSKPVVPEWQ